MKIVTTLLPASQKSGAGGSNLSSACVGGTSASNVNATSNEVMIFANAVDYDESTKTKDITCISEDIKVTIAP